MVTAVEHRGSFGDPIRRTVGSTWTERELRAITRAAKFGSRARVIRSLIDPAKLEGLISETESQQRRAAGN
jgi:hypothetical protein